MANHTPEQDLIDQFLRHLEKDADEDLRVAKIINKSCRSKTYADVEFESASKIHWVIEAKSDASRDRYNTVHKIFGELLKETGRKNRDDCRHAILIPSNAVLFYSRAFQAIHRDKFLGFGELIPVDTVFTCNETGVDKISWEAFYDAYAP